MPFDPNNDPTLDHGAKSERPGDRVDRYEIVEKLGEGGMGHVWKARDTMTGVDVALKFLPREARTNADVVAEVRESFRLAQALTHKAIGKVLTIIPHDVHGPVLVLEFIPGVTLKRFQRTNDFPRRRVPLDVALAILRPIAQALDYGHQEVVRFASGAIDQTGVLHRDIKPENILVLAQGKSVVKSTLVDYGIAAEIRASTTRFTSARFDTRGTLPYMSPEQARGKRSEWDGRTDQYSLAVVAYELLAGHVPFEADGGDEALRQSIFTETPGEISDVPPQVNAALTKALAKERAGRFGSCVEFVEALKAVGPPFANHSESAGRLSASLPVAQAAASAPPFGVETTAPVLTTPSKDVDDETRRRENERAIRQREWTRKVLIAGAFLLMGAMFGGACGYLSAIALANVPRAWPLNFVGLVCLPIAILGLIAPFGSSDRGFALKCFGAASVALITCASAGTVLKDKEWSQMAILTNGEMPCMLFGALVGFVGGAIAYSRFQAESV